MRSKRPPDPDRARRLRARAELDEGLAKLRGTPPRGKAKPAGGRRGWREASPVRVRATDRALVTLAELGVDVGPGGEVSVRAPDAEVEAGAVVGMAGAIVGQLAHAWRGPGAPIKVQLFASLPLARGLRVVAPSWLEAVRMMPCSECNAGRPFYEQLQLGVSQSQANHHPPRRCGSDLETHPVCVECHTAITEHRPTRSGRVATKARLDLLVAHTVRAVVLAIGAGRIHPGLLVAAGIEAVVSSEA